jgi:PAS domain-containing protein
VLLLYGLRPEDAQGSGWTRVLHREDHAAFADKGRAAREARELFEVEVRLR